MRKKLKLVALLLLTSVSLSAVTLQFTWDHPEPSDVEFYTVYELSGTNRVEIGTSTNLTLTASVKPGNRTFFATASAAGLESEPSEVLVEQIKPNPPVNLQAQK